MKLEYAAKRLQTFDEIYEMKLQAEQQEKAKQSVFDGKSQTGLMSATSKGMTPKRRNFGFKFKFGGDISTPKSSMAEGSGVIEGPGMGKTQHELSGQK